MRTGARYRTVREQAAVHAGGRVVRSLWEKSELHRPRHPSAPHTSRAHYISPRTPPRHRTPDRSSLAKRNLVLVPGALMHAAPQAVIVVHGVAHADALVIVLKDMTVASDGKASAARGAIRRGLRRRAANGSMLDGSCASTQAFISTRDTIPPCVFFHRHPGRCKKEHSITLIMIKIN